jgi:MFS transporter, ACS family, D-galactonate transporter
MMMWVVTKPASEGASGISAAGWCALALLVLTAAINYVDRANLSVAAPDLRTELGLSPAQLGLLLSAFYWTYAPFQIVSGWMVDRYDVNRVLAGGFFLWTAATAATGFMSGLGALLVIRLVVGAGEAVAIPAYSKIIATCFPEHNRGLTNALLDAGSKTGPAIATLLGGLIVARFGWRALFFILGFGGLLWLPLWRVWAPNATYKSRRQSQDDPGFVEILRQRSAWGTMLGLFCLNYVWYFLVTWLPLYLVMGRHFSTTAMAVWGSVPLWGLTISSPLSGWISDRLIARGTTTPRVRKGFAAAGMLMCTLLLPAFLVHESQLCVALFTVACLSFGMCTSNLWAITQTIAGPVAVGRWCGLQNAFGNLAGVTAPYVTGLLVHRTGSFYLAFLTVCAVAVVGAASFLFVVGPIEQVAWPPRPSRETSCLPSSEHN